MRYAIVLVAALAASPAMADVALPNFPVERNCKELVQSDLVDAYHYCIDYEYTNKDNISTAWWPHLSDEDRLACIKIASDPKRQAYQYSAISACAGMRAKF